MRLGAVYSNQHVNAFYRVYLPMVTMSERGHDVVEVLQERGVQLPVDRLRRCDLVHVHRPMLRDEPADSVALLQEAGVAVGFDEDDNVTVAPPELEPIVGVEALVRARADFDATVARAAEFDLVTTPNSDLAACFEEAGADNVRVVDNYLPGAFNRVIPAGHEGIAIGWHAAEEHRLDVAALGLDAILRRVLDVHPEVRVVTIGIDLGLDHDRYRCDPHVPIHDLTAQLADFDIGIVPLADTPFNRGRSTVKAREYAAAEVPWLASPVGPYRALGRDQGGMLVADDEWFAALDALVASSRERARLRKRARKWAERETIWRMAAVWERTFSETIADVRALA